MKRYIKDFLIYAFRLLLRLLYVFPIKKNRILLISYDGRTVAGSPKCIYSYLKEIYPQRFEFVWVLNEKTKHTFTDPHTKVISHNIFVYSFYALTSKIIVSNSGINRYLPFKKTQKYVETTHGGGAYKGTDATLTERHNEKMFNLAKKPDYLLSSCRAYSKITKAENHLEDEAILECGMPRNDIFFDVIKSTLQAKLVREQLGLQGKKILLYAPTFRGDFLNPHNTEDNVDFDKAIIALQKRFGGDWAVLYRAHYSLRDSGLHKSCIDVSDYADMQDLLCASDVLITDYSSSIWDYSFTGRPCFLYAPDLSNYKAERNFHTPIEEWPFSLALTNEQLEKNIQDYDEAEYLARVKHHHCALGSFESGNATKAICEKMYEMAFLQTQ